MSILRDAQRRLQEVRDKHDSILVAYSDGKDSRVVLDLCVNMFPRVEAFHLVIATGLEATEVALDQVKRRYGISVRQYLHPQVCRYLQDGIYCDPDQTVQLFSTGEIYALASVEANAEKIAVGFKRTDGANRRNVMKLFKRENVVYPVLGWTNYDIYAYLKRTGIGAPPAICATGSGIGLDDRGLLWLRKTFPNDYRRICEVYPYAEAVYWKFKFYKPEKLGD